MPASGVRRSWLIHATSSRRDASAARSRCRASRSHTLRRAIARPSNSATGSVTSTTSTHTSAIVVSVGLNMKPLTPSTPAITATTGTSTSTVIVVVREPRRTQYSNPVPSATTGSTSASATGRMSSACLSICPSDSPGSIIGTDSRAVVIAVPHSPHRRDPRRFRRGDLDLLTQPSHVDGHSGLVAEVPAPHLLQQLLAGERLAGVRQQEHQQVELPRGQRQLGPAQHGRAGGDVDPQVAVDEHL